MAKHQAGYRAGDSEVPEHPNGASATSVPPRPSAIVRSDVRRELLDGDALEDPSFPRPPAAPRVSHWLRGGDSPRARHEPEEEGTLRQTEAPRASANLAWGVASLIAGFGGGLLVAWLIGFV